MRTTTILAILITTFGCSIARAGEGDVDPRWLDRLEPVDRHLLNASIGYAAPDFTDDLKWHGSEALTWEDLRGKVVIVMNWTNRDARSSGAVARLRKSMGERVGTEIEILAVHTPKDLDTLDRWMERRSLDVPVMIDESGLFCDELGLYEKATNVLIDRHGAVRYAGLNNRGLLAAIKALTDEEFDAEKTADARPVAADTESAEFPPIIGAVSGAGDLRGRQAPTFHVDQWVTAAPAAPNGKVVIVDFWATWCGPCVAAIPHMNEIASRFGDDLFIVGISGETENDFRKGMDGLNRQKGYSVNSFRYNLALDPSKRMSKGFGVRGIPHIAVISSDWTVRWQGHPTRLTDELVEQIIKADQSQAGGPPSGQRYRWTNRDG